MNLSIRAKSITEQEPNLAVITAILITEIYRSNQSSNFSPHELVWTVTFPRHRRQNSPVFEPSCQELRWDQTSSTRMEHPDCRRSCNNKARQDFILVPKLAQIRTYQLSSIPLPIWIQFGGGGRRSSNSNIWRSVDVRKDNQTASTRHAIWPSDQKRIRKKELILAHYNKLTSNYVKIRVRIQCAATL